MVEKEFERTWRAVFVARSK